MRERGSQRQCARVVAQHTHTHTPIARRQHLSQLCQLRRRRRRSSSSSSILRGNALRVQAWCDDKDPPCAQRATHTHTYIHAHTSLGSPTPCTTVAAPPVLDGGGFCRNCSGTPAWGVIIADAAPGDATAGSAGPAAGDRSDATDADALAAAAASRAAPCIGRRCPADAPDGPGVAASIDRSIAPPRLPSSRIFFPFCTDASPPPLRGRLRSLAGAAGCGHAASTEARTGAVLLRALSASRIFLSVVSSAAQTCRIRRAPLDTEIHTTLKTHTCTHIKHTPTAHHSAAASSLHRTKPVCRHEIPRTSPAPRASSSTPPD